MTNRANYGKYDAKVPAGTTPIIQHNIGHWGISNVAVYKIMPNKTRQAVSISNLVLLDRDRLQFTLGANAGDLVVVVSA